MMGADPEDTGQLTLSFSILPALWWSPGSMGCMGGQGSGRLSGLASNHIPRCTIQNHKRLCVAF